MVRKNMVFVIDVDAGIEFDRVDQLTLKLDHAAQVVRKVKDISRPKIAQLVNNLRPLYEEILYVLETVERSHTGLTVPLKEKSFNVFGRWQLLARCLGKLSATSYYNDATFRSLLDQMDRLTANYKSSTAIHVVKDFLADASYGPDAGTVDGSILAQYASDAKVGFDNIIGMDAVKSQIRFKLRKIQAKWTAGGSYARLLLYGPPGTGKTLFAEAMANEMGYLFIKLGNSELADQYVGEGEKRLTNILRGASQDTLYKGVFILFDEIDSFTGRGSDVSFAQKSITTTMLQEINNNLSDHIFICATTNFPRKVDAALLRRLLPGVAVTLPDEESIRLFIQNRSPFGRLVDRYLPNLAPRMYKSHYSQDNITQFLAQLLDKMAEWGTAPLQKYTSLEGSPFQALYAGKEQVTTVICRDETGSIMEESAILSDVQSFGIPLLPTTSQTVHATMADLARLVWATIIPSSTNVIEESMLGEDKVV